MIYELVSRYDKLLKTELPRFDFSNPPVDPIELAHSLAQTMLDKNGMGLAANQIGLPYRAFAIKANPILVCFNPIIVDESLTKQIYLEEGCLSFPGLIIKIKRPAKIKVRYTEPNGETVTKTFDGLTARIFQHELAHLNGRTFLDDANLIHKEKALKEWKKLGFK